MTLMLTFGKSGGFYIAWGYSKRICLWWLAITFIPRDMDQILNTSLDNASNSLQPIEK